MASRLLSGCDVRTRFCSSSAYAGWYQSDDRIIMETEMRTRFRRASCEVRVSLTACGGVLNEALRSLNIAWMFERSQPSPV